MNQYVGGNNLIYQAGHVRKIPVSIGGTSWKPEMPSVAKIKEKISEILALGCPTDRALTLMLWLMRQQMFLDGNKRTAILSGNQIMIKNGCGIISIPIEHQHEFKMQLVEYYETNDMEKLKEFTYNNCIDGIDFE